MLLGIGAMFSGSLLGVWRDFCAVFAHEPIGVQLAIGIGLALIVVLALEGLRVSFFPTWFARRHLATLSHPAQVSHSHSHSHSMRAAPPANEDSRPASRPVAPPTAARRNKKKTVRRARRIAKPMRRLT